MPQLHRFAGGLIFVALLAGLLLPAARRDEGPARAATPAAARPKEGTPATARPPSPVKPAAPATPATTRLAPAAPAARQVKANELGKVPVLMYHRIVAKQQVYLDRTPGELRAELTRLAKERYVPVTAAEYVSGALPVPAGRHPVVLTFDDASPSQFGFESRGGLDADSAVGILMEVAAKYPGFRPVATFYVNKDPFMMGDGAVAGMRWLAQRGFELGNHTYSHSNLGRLSESGVGKEIARGEKLIRLATGTPSVTHAYPFGVPPRRSSWISEGKSGGLSWKFSGTFMAGWWPASSPYDEDFKPLDIPRIRSEAKITADDCKKYCSTAWLDWLKKHPGERYTSDGDPAVISIPANESGELGKNFRARARVY